MRFISLHFLLVLFFSKAMAVSKPTGTSGVEVFTIGQVKVGQTSQKELLALGAQSSNGEEFILKGLRFGVNPANGLVYSFTREVHQTWPTTWTNSELTAELSVDEVLKWIQKNGYREVKMPGEIDGTKISDKKVYVIKFFFDQKEKLSNVILFCTVRP